MPCCCSSPGPCKWWQKIVSLLVVASILVMAGFYLFSPKEVSEEVTTIEEPLKELVEVNPVDPIRINSTEIPAFGTIDQKEFNYTVEQLTAMAVECGTEHEEGYFEELVATYEGVNKVVYNFAYGKESQDSGMYHLIAIPNLMDYETLDEFNADFGQCYAAGDAYPKMLNQDWLVFVGSCGSGFDDGSGLPHGCQEIKDVVDPSLELQ